MYKNPSNPDRASPSRSIANKPCRVNRRHFARNGAPKRTASDDKACSLVSLVFSETKESPAALRARARLVDGANLFARVYTGERVYEVSKLRKLSRRTTDAMRQEAHDYRLALGSFAAAASAPAARDAREQSYRSAIATRPDFQRGEHVSTHANYIGVDTQVVSRVSSFFLRRTNRPLHSRRTPRPILSILRSILRSRRRNELSTSR